MISRAAGHRQAKPSGGPISASTTSETAARNAQLHRGSSGRAANPAGPGKVVDQILMRVWSRRQAPIMAEARCPVSGYVPPPDRSRPYLTAANRRVAGPRRWPLPTVGSPWSCSRGSEPSRLTCPGRTARSSCCPGPKLCRLLVSSGPPQVPWHRFRGNMRVSRIRPGVVRLYGHTVDPPGEYPVSRAFPG